MTRFEKIKGRLFDVEYQTKKQWWGEDTTILANEEIKKEPLVIRKALAVRYVMNNMPVEIKPDELIVGIANMSTIGFGKVFPAYALKEEKEEAAKSSLGEGSVWGHHPVRYDKVLSIGLSGIRREIYGKIKEFSSNGAPEAFMRHYRASGWSSGCTGTPRKAQRSTGAFGRVFCLFHRIAEGAAGNYDITGEAQSMSTDTTTLNQR